MANKIFRGKRVIASYPLDIEYWILNKNEKSKSLEVLENDAWSGKCFLKFER